ncbi:hypothetical protein BLNAU_2866 [Blattamonas nauphoetae]|uniref:Uncharacterized protein n=1 Tax=Blattamonas nauphoetae TaxID=2049346 RepID=A0ABQ9YEK2_9EUKA|nr:hypothetical protein BLNAU_2866 [Blattamonas nauphoetae]
MSASLRYIKEISSTHQETQFSGLNNLLIFVSKEEQCPFHQLYSNGTMMLIVPFLTHENPDFQSIALSILINCTCAPERHIDSLLEQNILEILVKLLSSDSYLIIGKVLSILGNLCSSSQKAMKALLPMNPLTLIWEFLTESPTLYSPHPNLCWFISSLSVNPISALEISDQQTLLKYLWECSQLENFSIIQDSLWALASFLDDQDLITIFSSVANLLKLVAFLGNDCLEISLSALKICVNISFGSDILCVQLGQADIYTQLHMLLQNDSVQIISEVCIILGNMIKASSQLAILFLNSDIPFDLRDIICQIPQLQCKNQIVELFSTFQTLYPGLEIPFSIET